MVSPSTMQSRRARAARRNVVSTGLVTISPYVCAVAQCHDVKGQRVVGLHAERPCVDDEIEGAGIVYRRLDQRGGEMGTERPHERIAPRCVEFDDREGMSARFRGAQPIADPAPISAHRVFATSKPTRLRASTRASPSVISPTSEPSASRRTIFAPPVACARGESVSQRLATACTVTEGPTQLLVRRNPATSALSPSGATSTGMRTAFAPRFSRRALIGSARGPAPRDGRRAQRKDRSGEAPSVVATLSDARQRSFQVSPGAGCRHCSPEYRWADVGIAAVSATSMTAHQTA